MKLGIASRLALPALAFGIFLAGWSLAASRIQSEIGTLPGPLQVVAAARGLFDAHVAERAKQRAFERRQAEERELAEGAGALFRERRYAGRPTYLDQIGTSLLTVFAGFGIAVLVAVPVGIACGLSPALFAALNPLIQLLRPVSPLAWLPLVMIFVSALSTARDPCFEKSFLSSAITVALCSLWPALVNTALGVGSVERDHLNVARVLRLPWPTVVRRIVIPSALPWIFSGLRISLGVGWMVLIAAEMLAQNPGLGKFVWDMFQSGGSEALAQIVVAVFTIGSIGFGLDRGMTLLERAVAQDASA